MIPIEFTDANMKLVAPEDWDEDDGPCNPLAVFHDKENNAYLSCWKPSQAELEILNAGGVVALVIRGSVHPPVSLEAVETQEI